MTLDAPRTRLMLDDSKARVFVAEIPPKGRYVMHAPISKGSVWVAVDGSGLVVGEAPDGGSRNFSSGDTRHLEPARTVEFRNTGDALAHIIVVNVKRATNTPVPQVFQLTPGHTLEEHTPDNGVLLVAISPIRLREVMASGEPDDPTPGESRVINMRQGQVTWLGPGMRTLTNLAGKTVRFVWIEW